jgi:hypothetical protein
MLNGYDRAHWQELKGCVVYSNRSFDWHWDSSVLSKFSLSVPLILVAKYLRAWATVTVRVTVRGEGKMERTRREQYALCAVASPPSTHLGWLANKVCICDGQRSSEIFCGKSSTKHFPTLLSSAAQRLLLKCRTVCAERWCGGVVPR